MPTSPTERKIIKTSRFTRDLKKIPAEIQLEAYSSALKLKMNVFNEELNILQLTGYKGIFRVIIKHDYRLIYTYDEENLYLLRIAHRKDIYKRLEL